MKVAVAQLDKGEADLKDAEETVAEFTVQSIQEGDSGMRAFNQLPFEQKEALILTAGEFSYDEAAAICGCAVGTIKSRVSRARKRLESLVEGKDGVLPARSEHPEDPTDAFFKFGRYVTEKAPG